MGRPCETRHPTPVPDTCKTCYLSVNHPGAQKAWGLLVTATGENLKRHKTNPTQRVERTPVITLPVVVRDPCRFENEVIEHCKRNDITSQFRNLHDCELHDRCVRDRRFGKFGAVASCRQCGDYDSGRPAKVFSILEDDPYPTMNIRPTAQTRLEIDRHREALGKVDSGKWLYLGPDEGDGIIIVGGGQFWPGVLVALHMLRRTGCTLPVEVWHRGALEPVNHDAVKDLGDVRIIDAHAIRNEHPWRVLGGWEMKAHALQRCAFRRVLYLDADAYPVSDPTALFELLNQAPLVFWADIPTTFGNVRWNNVGVVGQFAPRQIQGGQLLFDRKECWHELVLSYWMNQHSDFYYDHAFGDQDCWRIAWSLTGRKSLCLGDANWDKYPIEKGEERVAFICSYEGRPVFVHRCRSKMFKGIKSPRCHSLPREVEAWDIFEQVTR